MAQLNLQCRVFCTIQRWPGAKMQMAMTDADLLGRFIEVRDQQAFSYLAQRHLDFVYTVALRRVGGDHHLASDVCQEVFSALANKARAARRHPSLMGWLHTATRYSAAHAVRAQMRRRAAEIRAAKSGALDAPEAGASFDWGNLVSPIIDEAIGSLGSRDREAVLLRYFKNLPFAEIGQVLGTTDSGARLRVTRALDKMNAWLATRGITSSTAALAAAMASAPVSAAPAPVVKAILSAAAATSARSGVGAAIGGFGAALSKYAAITLIVCAAGTVLYQQQEWASLKANSAAASAQAWDIDALRNEKARLENVLAERNSSSPARGGETAASAIDPSWPAPSSPLVAHEFVPASSLTFRGAQSPEDALETYFWALVNRRVDVLGQLLGDRPTLASESPVGLLSWATAGMDGPLARVRLDAVEAIDSNTAYLTGRDITSRGEDLNFDLIATKGPTGWTFSVDPRLPWGSATVAVAYLRR